jgi:hypothetical protein
VFDAQSHSVSSPYPRVYKKITYNPCSPTTASTVQTVPIYTIIIGLEKGVPSYLTWDDGCFFCAENGADCVHTALDVNTSTEVQDSGLRGCRQAIDTKLSPPADNCYPTASLPSDNSTGTGSSGGNVTSPCDLKVYVTWTGTDRNGKFLRSSGQRFSRFRAFGVASLYQSALNLGNEVVNLANSAAGIAQGIPGRVVPS